MVTSMPEVKAPLTLFYREGCHLCEDMEAQLYELLDAGSFALQKVDIDSSSELHAAYNVRVPVLFCGQVEVCEHFLDLQALRTALAVA